MAAALPSNCGDVRISIMTFNMGNAALNSDEIAILYSGEADADIYVFGLQESTYSINKKETAEKSENDDKFQRHASMLGHSKSEVISAERNPSFVDNVRVEMKRSASAVRDGIASSTSTVAAIIRKSDSLSDKEVIVEEKLSNEVEVELQRRLGDGFYKVGSRQRAQMQIIVFARNALRDYIPKDHFFTNAENTGFAHVFPNKGGICVSMLVGSTRLAFISCHLAAHEGVEKCKTRNASIEEILGGVRFQHDSDGKYDVSMTHHHTFLMGDLNYRITFDPRTPMDISDAKRTSTVPEDAVLPPMTPPRDEKSIPNPTSPTPSSASASNNKEDDEEEDGSSVKMTKERKAHFELVFRWIEGKQWDELSSRDELLRELKARRILTGFDTLPLTFPPTFKRVRKIGMGDGSSVATTLSGSSAGSASPSQVLLQLNEQRMDDDVSDASVASYYNTQRMPSYTDRVLFKSLPGFRDKLTNIAYFSHEGIKTSDHKPVRAIFLLQQSMSASLELPETLMLAGLALQGGHSFKSTGGNSPKTMKNSPASFKNSPASLASPASVGSPGPRLGSMGLAERVSLRGRSSMMALPLIAVVTMGKFQGRGLAKMDISLFGGSSDPYITVTLDPPQLINADVIGSNLRTKTIYKELNPHWRGQEINIKLHKASSNVLRGAHILVSVWDEDTITEDDLIGSCLIPVRDLLPDVEVAKNSVGFETPGPICQLKDIPLLQNGLVLGELSFDVQLKFVPEVGVARVLQADTQCRCVMS